MTLDDAVRANYDTTLYECPLSGPCCMCPYYVTVFSSVTSSRRVYPSSRGISNLCVLGLYIYFSNYSSSYSAITGRPDLLRERAARRGQS